MRIDKLLDIVFCCVLWLVALGIVTGFASAIYLDKLGFLLYN